VRGFSLIEVMVATALLAVAALVAFPTILSFFDLSDMAREENIATHDLMAAVEEVMATPFASVTTSYPPGQAIPKYANLHLRGEQVMVNYTDPNQDPLEVVLTATWLDRRGRTRQEAFRCMRTR
jgi:prepilin-type N-terminal cleavage/methylation domain-containing protein